MVISKWYNGWSPEIRSVRGGRFYQLLRKKALPPAVKCELCGSINGLTFHAEEYGSTWQDYLKSTHALCCYCHATFHVRERYPNRWTRFVARAVEGDFPDFPYTSMSQVYGVYRGVKDIPEPVAIPDSDHWVTKLTATPYTGPPKIALAPDGLSPDPLCYPSGLSELSGVAFSTETQILTPYNWSAQ